MKVFISHSSYDKWVARTISQQLNVRGVETFLDEKDMQTGESIDGAIADHLNDANELLLLLSPASLKSSWVFIEIGGAKALGKHISPILLHVGANEVPQPIAQLLCRDINDIERYYEEIKARIGGRTPRSRRHAKRPSGLRARLGKPSRLSVGNVVRIKDPATVSDESKRKPPAWIAEMDPFSGREYRVTKVRRDGAVVLEGNIFVWLPEWLELVPAAD